MFTKNNRKYLLEKNIISREEAGVAHDENVSPEHPQGAQNAPVAHDDEED